MKKWLYPLAFLLLTGCGAVFTQKPLPQATLTAEQKARFEGVWAGGSGGGAVVALAFGCDGVVRLAGIDWRKNDFQLQRFEMTIAQGKQAADESGYFSVRPVPQPGSARDQKKEEWPGYVLVRYAFPSKTELLLWTTNPDPFVAAIKAGRLKGNTKKDGIQLTGSPQELLDFLGDPANTALFDYEKPIVLRKVSSNEDNKPMAACEKK